MSENEETRFTMPDRRMRTLEIAHSKLEERLAGNDKALEIAKQEVDRRLLGMNELREQISIERNQYLSRLEFESKHQALIDQVNALQKFQWLLVGGLTVLEIFIGIALHYWHG